MRVLPPLLLLILAASAPAADLPNPLHGTWVREVDNVRVTLKVVDKRLLVTVVQSDHNLDGRTWTRSASLDADYASGADARIVGVVTGVDVVGTHTPDRGAPLWYKAAPLKKLEGAPFAFRARIDGDTLTVAELRAEGLKRQPEVLSLTGKFERATATTGPTPNPVAPAGYYPPPMGAMTAPPPTRLVPPYELPPIPIPFAREEAPKPRPVFAPAPEYYPLPSQRIR